MLTLPACTSCIPKRYVVCFLVFCALAINYIQRFSLGLLITVMVRPIHPSGSVDVDLDLYCPRTVKTLTNSSRESIQHGGEFSWDEYTQGIILSSFFWGYILTQLPGGMIAERVGGKYTMAWAVLVPSVTSLLTPVVVRHGGPWALVALRVVNGLGQGFTYPSISELLSKWAPLEERGRLASTVFAGSYFGNVVSMSLSGLILTWTEGDWATVLYLYGGIGLGWLLVWQWLGYSRPEDHPGLSPTEREYMEQYAKTVNLKKKLPTTPWIDILTSVRMWASAIAFIGINWGKFSSFSNLPKYMTSVLNFSVAQTGLWTALFYMATCVGGWTASMAVDYIKALNIMSVTVTRKVFVTIGLLVPSVLFMAASFAGCDKDMFLVLMTLAIGVLGFDCAGVALSSLDLSTNYAGSVMAFINTMGAISGILSPYFMGVIVSENTLLEWRYLFVITAVVMVLADIFFIIFSSADIQPWNDPSPSEDLTETRRATDNSNEDKFWIDGPTDVTFSKYSVEDPPRTI